MRCLKPTRLIALVALLATLAVPSTAHAGDGYGAARSWSCTGGSGGRDNAGVLYTPCGSRRIAIVSPTGSVSVATVDAAAKAYYGIAPAPDGRSIYTIMYSNGASTALGMSLQRLKFNAARTALVPDPTFVPRRFAYGGGTRGVCGRDLATDAYGYIYVSNGGWCAQGTGETAKAEPTMVVKYRPDGTIVTTFGEYGTGPGEFRTNMGIDVSRDGRRIYVAETSNRRVQYFDWQFDGSYAPAGMITYVGNGDLRHRLAATYDVKLDDWGYVYVAETTAADYWKLRPDGSTLTRIVDLPGSGTTANRRLHVISVDGRGYAYSNESRAYWPRAADNPVPATRPPVGPEPLPDLLAPQLRAITGPSNTHVQVVRVSIDAVDVDGTIDAMRLADASGEWQPWRSYEPSFDLDLGAGYGTKVVYAQVRDSAGHESGVTRMVVSLTPPPDTTAPTLAASGPLQAAPGPAVLTLDARDDVAVTHVRVAQEDGIFGPWLEWDGSGLLQTTLQAGPDGWTRSVQVRDAAWNVSMTATVTMRRYRATTSSSRDRVAPRIVRLVVPRRSCSRRIVVRIGARDAGRIVAIRFANERGRYGRWRRYQPRMVHVLSGRRGAKRIRVQVRDAAGNVSRASSRRTRIVACRRR